MEYQLNPRILLGGVAAFLTLLAVSCSSGADSSDRLEVVATTTQIGDFAREVGGDGIGLTVLLKPNQDAHDFDPQPSQLRAIADADVVLRNGIGLDAFVNRAVEQSDASVAVVSDDIDLREHDEGDHRGEQEEDGADREGDPHVWLSVANARVMVENIRDAFVTADPENAATYEANAAAYINRLESLDTEIKAAIATIPPSCRKLVTNHDVFGYYAEAYGLEVVGSIIPGVSTEAKPSAADIASIVTRIREEKVPAVFAEASMNPALVNQVAGEAGVEVVDDLYADSLGPSGSDGGTYIGMMRSNTEKIVSALKDCPAP